MAAYDVKFPSLSRTYFANGRYYCQERGNLYKHEDFEFFLRTTFNGKWNLTQENRLLYVTVESTGKSPDTFKRWLQDTNGRGGPYPISILVTSVSDEDAEASFRSKQAAKPDSVADWEIIENTEQTTYRNKNTGETCVNAPRVLHNVGSLLLSGLNPQGQIHAPLDQLKKLNQAEINSEHKSFRVNSWAQSEDLWQKSLEALEGQLTSLQGRLAQAANSPAILELKMHESTLAKRRAEVEEMASREAAAYERLANMTARHGVTHVKRDLPAVPGGTQFPTGEEIIARYAAAFGGSFESAARQAIAFIEDALKERDGAKTLVDDVLSGLFAASRAYSLHCIQAKYRRLAEAFGLPAWGTESATEADSIAVHFFLTSQQEPLLKAAAGISETAVREIVKLMGAKAESVLAGLPAWAKKRRVAVLFDLPQLVRTLVWVNTAIELSDPKCYLHPPVALTQRHIAGQPAYQAIFADNDGATASAGKAAQVVVPGLYFERATEAGTGPGAGGGAVPAVPARVRYVTETEGTGGGGGGLSAALWTEERRVADMVEELAQLAALPR